MKFDQPIKVSSYVNDRGIFTRPTLETVFINTAIILAARSTCFRAKVGALFTDIALEKVLCIGHNGNYAKGPNQCDSDQEGACGCLHAEMNALIKSTTDLKHAVCFVTLAPCLMCSKALINRGISKVVYYEDYRNTAGIDLLQKMNIEVVKFDNMRNDEILKTLDVKNTQTLFQDPNLDWLG